MADPNNKLNQNLDLGGTLSAAAVAATSVFARTLNGLITQHGAGFGFAAIEVAATLDTTGDTTTIEPPLLPAGALPAGAIVWGASVIVTTTVAGVNSTDLDVQITGDQGGGAAATSVANLTGPFAADDSAAQNLFPPLSVTVADTILVVLSKSGGGGDNTPSAGAVRIAVFYTNTTPLLS